MNLQETDPEFMERFEHFALHEVVSEENQSLEEQTRSIVILAALIGCQGTDAYREMLPQALRLGVTPVMVKEIVYQAADYLGYARMLPFLKITNEILIRHGVPLPLDGQATTTPDNRLEKGVQIQTEIFGEQMKEAWKTGTSTAGWQQIALAITIREQGLRLRSGS